MSRTALAGARLDRLYFAQVREDPALELAALSPRSRRIAVVSSGGCTALSLLAAGARVVTAIDTNIAQNHLVELKVVALCQLPPAPARAFLGATAAPARSRDAVYRLLRSRLSAEARAYWDAHDGAIRRGVLGAGVTERFIRMLVRVIRVAIHPEQRIRRLLACCSLAEQQAFYAREWDSRRWRLLFPLLLNRRALAAAYDERMFACAESLSFATHFRDVVRHTLTELPLRTNYFVHHMLTGAYPADVPGGVPPYLSDTGADCVRALHGRLHLVDGSFTAWLRQAPAQSIDGFALSNICEWLGEREIGELFAQIVRTATPGATVCFRNFVGWTEVPHAWRSVIVEDRACGARLIASDRSAVQRRIGVCTVCGSGT
ncbi:MAG: DUF3419 family protein [Gemmatimonadaceae bacterium]